MRNVLKSGNLVLVLLLIFYMNIGLSITGVSVKKEREELKVIDLIKEDFPQAENFVFFDFDRSVVICEDRSWIRVFDLQGRSLKSVLASKVDIDSAQVHFIGHEDEEVALGFAYGELVYALQKPGLIWLLDIEDFSTVFHYEEGD